MTDNDSFLSYGGDRDDADRDGGLQQLLLARLAGELNSPKAGSQAIYQATITKYKTLPTLTGTLAPAPLPPVEAAAQTARTDLPYIEDVFLNYDYPTMKLEAFDTILAFSFGDQKNPAGAGALPLPGPVNEQIAEATYDLYSRLANKKPKVFAQWEVAQVLTSRYNLPAGVLTSVGTPTVSATGAVSIPSLSAVVTAVLAQTSVQALGKVAVVTHRDQEKSAILNTVAGVQTVNNVATHITAAGVRGLLLPAIYDTSASLPVNRRRDLFLAIDFFNQLGMIRD